jgi:hypothetical protein
MLGVANTVDLFVQSSICCPSLALYLAKPFIKQL